MKKKKCKLLIETTFKQYVEYEYDDAESEADVLERAYNDTDLLANALDTDEFDTAITVIPKE